MKNNFEGNYHLRLSRKSVSYFQLFLRYFCSYLNFANRLFLSAIARWWKWLDYFIIDKSPDSYDCFHILYHSLCVEYVELLKWTSWWDFSSYFDFGSTFRLWFWNIFEQFGLYSSHYLSLFVVLGMAGYFGAISKAPLTAMFLVTEMVGDFRQLMTIAVVTLVAYIAMDLLKGEPIYEALLAKLSVPQDREVTEPTLIELTVSDKIAGRYVRDLTLLKMFSLQLKSTLKNQKLYQVVRV